jgi:hypothetical protein
MNDESTLMQEAEGDRALQVLDTEKVEFQLRVVHHPEAYSRTACRDRIVTIFY